LFPGALVAAGDQSGNRFFKAFGHAQLIPRATAMQTNTMFDIESLTKVVATATAMAICIDDGLLDLDAPVRTYLPGLQGVDSETIKLRHLITHTSGYKWGRILDLPKQISASAFFARALQCNRSTPPGSYY